MFGIKSFSEMRFFYFLGLGQISVDVFLLFHGWAVLFIYVPKLFFCFYFRIEKISNILCKKNLKGIILFFLNNDVGTVYYLYIFCKLVFYDNIKYQVTM